MSRDCPNGSNGAGGGGASSRACYKVRMMALLPRPLVGTKLTLGFVIFVNASVTRKAICREIVRMLAEVVAVEEEALALVSK